VLFSQGETPDVLEENIRDAYRLMIEGEISHWSMVWTNEIIRKQLGLKWGWISFYNTHFASFIPL